MANIFVANILLQTIFVSNIFVPNIFASNILLLTIFVSNMLLQPIFVAKYNLAQFADFSNAAVLSKQIIGGHISSPRWKFAPNEGDESLSKVAGGRVRRMQ